MPTTAATMNVRIGADIAPLQKGLRQAQASVDQSAKLMGAAFSKTATASDGSRVATEFLRGLNSEFKAANTRLKASLFQGALTPEQFRAQGQQLAEEFNAGITTGLKRFGDQGLLTPEIEARLVGRYKRAGLDAGEAAAAGISRNLIPATNSAAGAFGALGEKGKKAGLNAGVAMSQLALDIGSSASASTKLVRAVSDVSLVFGPEGFLVAGILNAGLVMYQFFNKAQAEAEATAKKFRESIGSLVNAGDVAELNRQKLLLVVGTPANGVGQGGGFKGGLLDLQSQRPALARRVSAANTAAADTINAGNAFGVVAGGADDRIALAKLDAAIATASRQVADIDARIAVAAKVTSSFKFLLPGGGASGGGGGGAGGGSSPIDSLIKQSDTLLALQKNVASGGEPLIGLNSKLLDNLIAVNAALAAQADQFGEVALKLRNVRDGLLGANDAALKSLVGVTPGAPVASSGITVPSVIAGVPDQGKNIDLKNLPTIPSKLDTLGKIFQDSIKSQSTFIAQSLVTVLGIKQANAGGAIGSVIGGAVGGAVAGKAIGAGAGAIAGSVVPVVGTVIGSVVGGFIGNAIGGLFSHHKKAADNSATALNSLASAANRVSEALTNVPSGFRVAYERYIASIPTTYASRAGSGGGVHIYGDVALNGVQSTSDLYDSLSTEARARGSRGGTQPLALALGVGGR